MKAITLTGSSITTKRRELDFYPTPPEVTHALMNFLKLDKCKIWEPACGNGAMSEVIESYGHLVHSSDVRHTGYGIGNLDFLDSNLTADAIITNPPFNISQDFIKHALNQAPVVAMLLKVNYFHAQCRIELFENNPPAYVLALTWRPDFHYQTRKPGEKAAPPMEVCWFVWIKGDVNSKYRILKK
jgi:hypothetical protein